MEGRVAVRNAQASRVTYSRASRPRYAMSSMGRSVTCCRCQLAAHRRISRRTWRRSRDKWRSEKRQALATVRAGRRLRKRTGRPCASDRTLHRPPSSCTKISSGPCWPRRASRRTWLAHRPLRRARARVGGGSWRRPSRRSVASWGEEVKRKIGGDGRLRFGSLRAADVQGNARSWAALVKAGMPKADASRVVGFEK